jgi:hypothetical protein
MSWSFNAVGKASAVAAAARAAKEKNPCIEPEETYRQESLEHIAKMADSLMGAACSVNASGSMWKEGGLVKSHTIALDFKPLYGFLE